MVGSRKRASTGEEDLSPRVSKISDVGNIDQNDLDSIVNVSTEGITGAESPTQSPGKKATASTISDPVGAVVLTVITPEKPKKQFYVMNKQNGAIQSFDSFELASQFKNAMATFAPILAFTAVIKDFQSEAEARAYLDTYTKVPMPNALEANSSDSDDGKIAAEPRLEIARQKASQDVVVIDDVDQVPFSSVGSTSVQPSGAANYSPQMSAFAAATIGLGTSIAVTRWRLPACDYHVYSFKLMDGREQYWSHKPQMWMYAVQTEKIMPLFLPGENMSLHRAMNRCNAAGIRATPGGENTILTFRTPKTHKDIRQYLLYGLVKCDKSNEDIGNLIKSFVQHCQKQNIREAYYLTVREKMVSPAICEDTKPTGKYWIKLASGANNIVFEEKRRLSDVFLDEDIEIIINLAYNTVGQTQQQWLPHVRIAAYGGHSASG
jgi:hypothetical protein